MKCNILILSAGRRAELVLAFKEQLVVKGLDGEVIAIDNRPELSAACRVADCYYSSPKVSEPNYIEFLINLCENKNVSIIIPTIDPELLLLSQNRDRFYSKGINLIVSNESFVRKCRDKRLTSKLFLELGIDTPKIFERTAIHFPCFAKPYDGSCSIGAMPLLSSDMLSDSLLADKKMMFMELIDSRYEEFTIDAYYDRDGELRCFVPRQRIEVRAGEVSKGVTRRHHVYDYLKDKLPRINGARGCVTIQLFARINGSGFSALEINPRFGGGYPLSYSAGANYPGWIIDEYFLGLSVTFSDDWESDLMMLRYDAKVLVHDFQ